MHPIRRLAAAPEGTGPYKSTSHVSRSPRLPNSWTSSARIHEGTFIVMITLAPLLSPRIPHDAAELYIIVYRTSERGRRRKFEKFEGKGFYRWVSNFARPWHQSSRSIPSNLHETHGAAYTAEGAPVDPTRLDPNRYRRGVSCASPWVLTPVRTPPPEGRDNRIIVAAWQQVPRRDRSVHETLHGA